MSAGEWTAPPASAPHWDAFAQEGVLRFQRCSRCRTPRFPPAAECPRCLADAAVWEAASGRGAVVSWVVFHRAYGPARPVPYPVLVVALEEGPHVLAELVGADTGLRAGAPVRLAVVGDDGVPRAGFRLV